MAYPFLYNKKNLKSIQMYKQKIALVLVVLFICVTAGAQELFTYTEPASNMAKGTIGIRANSSWMVEKETNTVNFHFLPEVMIGINKKWMMHAEGFVSNRSNKFIFEGASIYGKFRFFSIDEVHSHLRLAAFTKWAKNNSDIHQLAIDLNGHNSGYEFGMVCTKLKNKVAVSTSVSMLHAFDNGAAYRFAYGDAYRNAMNYSFSIGKLMLPKTYVHYNQTNVNVMGELLGQTNFKSGKTCVDVGPVVQMIFLSKMRLDLSYRFAITNALERSASNGALVRLEYNFFNAF
jgi:hypothetical protein